MNAVTTVLFDLDGTLLPMDQDVFVKTYMSELAVKGATLGYDPQQLVQIVMAGVEVMVKNDGTMTNEQRFWELFMEHFSGDMAEHIAVFEEFYLNEFSKVEKSTSPTSVANHAIQILKAKGYELVLATNPIFPQVATRERMRWAGLNPRDFALITTYESSCFAKPNLGYYHEILNAISTSPGQCLMVGNDVQEDLAVTKLGMNVFLVTDDLINATGENIADVPQGNRQQMLDYFEKMPTRG